MKLKFNKKINIGSRTVSDDTPAFLIGEVGANFNGLLKTAKKLIDIAAEAGMDAVKFQLLDFNEQYIDHSGFSALKKLHQKIELPIAWLADLSHYAGSRGLIFLCSSTFFRAIVALEKIKAKVYKIASPQTVGSASMIRRTAKTGKPLVVSTGYCSFKEIERAVHLIHDSGNKDLILLHCVSQYPVRAEDINLAFLPVLKKKFDCLVGFSDHTTSTTIPAIAVSLGARVIEKHFTISRKMKGPDHKTALEPKELKEMVKNVREAEAALGSAKNISLSEGEKKFKELVKVKLVAARNLDKDSRLKVEDLIFKRAPGGIEDWLLDKYLNRRLSKKIMAGSVLKTDDFRRL